MNSGSYAARVERKFAEFNRQLPRSPAPALRRPGFGQLFRNRT